MVIIHTAHRQHTGTCSKHHLHNSICCLEMQGRSDVKAIPALLAEEQWEALGRRLQGIESSLQVSQAPVPCIVHPCT